MQKHRLTMVLAVALLALSCSGNSDRASNSPVSTSSPRTETSEGLCSLFTREEIQELLGTPVEAGDVAGPLGTACQWNGSADDSAYAQIQVLRDTSYWEKPSLAKDYETLDGIGREAFVVPEMGGWRAGALTDAAVIMVSVNGGTVNRDTAVQFLRSGLERL
jgi:hypothetical protein